MEEEYKFCSVCGEKINKKAVICPKCGCQVEKTEVQSPNIVINNVNQNTQGGLVVGARPKNKWTAIALCVFLGYFGAHKFYEEKTGLGVLYLLTGGLFFVGCIIDLISLLFNPVTYYV